MKKLALVALAATAFSWDTPAYSQSMEEVRNVITADSLKSGNYKDVLTSFFQLAFKNLTGPSKELNFNSNPFAVMARANPKLLEGESWYNYRHLRALNISAGVGLDSNYKLKNFSAGLKYAIINSRDLTISTGFFATVAASPETQSRNQLKEFVTALISRYSKDAAKQHRLLELSKHLEPQSEEPWSMDNLKVKGNELFSEIQTAYNNASKEEKIRYKYVKWLLDNPTENPVKGFIKYYDHLKDEWLQKPLWTVYTDGTSYSDQFTFEHANLGSQFLVGIPAIGKRTFTGEFDLKALLSFSDDKVKQGRNLERSIFSFEPGINFALRSKADNKSFLEFKLSGSYYNVLSGVQPGEKRDSLTMNAEIRLRVYDDIWVPVSIRYDLEHQNLFGFLNVSANFTGLKNLLGGSAGRNKAATESYK